MKKVIRETLSPYFLTYPAALTYMLQASEYRTQAYLKWLLRTRDFSSVQYRKRLDLTPKARLIKAVLSLGMLVEVLLGLFLVIYGIVKSGADIWRIEIGAAIILAYPFIWALVIVLPLEFARLFIVEPKQAKQIAESSELFKKHQAIKIAVAGSYGKTTMKELLKTVLSEGKRVAVTPANKNVPSEHAKFISSLEGKKDILVIEYGEGAPGDVARFAKNTHPDYAVITGLAPAHLDKYKTLAAAGDDIFSLAEYLKNKNVYVNADSPETKPYLKPQHITYSEKGAGEWRASNIKVGFDGVGFSLSNGQEILKLHSALLGRHQVGPLSVAAALARKLGLSAQQVEKGIAQTKAFAHRMQPRQIDGAWIIDDTYNGNIEGIKAGCALLSELPAKRKIYVTPGLVDQGSASEAVHLKLGQLVAAAQPDLVVLINNSVTKFIKAGLDAGGFKKELKIIDDPLNFYSNIDSLIASGDLLLMQNDWTDNYA